MKLAKRIMSIEPSVTLGITSKAKEMVSSGEDVVILAAGEPDFDTPEAVKEAAIKAIREGKTKYTPVVGTQALREAICRKLKNDNGLGYEPSEVVVSNGAKHSLYNILQVICNPGDEVLIISPYWLSYPEMVKLAGGVPKILPMRTENGFKINAGDIKSSLTGKTRALIINSPSNPAGVVYTRDELAMIAGTCVEAGITIISDEIYEKIIFDNEKHFSIAASSPEARSMTVVVNGLSKSHSMTGWRMGYAAGDKEMMKKISILQGQSTSNACSITQAASERALAGDLEEEIKRNCREFEKRRDVLMGLLAREEKIKPFKPKGAFYLFCDISRCGMDSLTFAKRLLAEKRVAVIPGGPFGADGFIRMSFATKVENLEKGISRIKDWVRSL